jgi:hypothetical protein
MWEQRPQMEDALPAPPIQQVPAPLPATIWGPPVDMLLHEEKAKNTDRASPRKS